MARIDIHDTPANAVLKLVDNDKAAAMACIAMVKAVERVDPQAEFGPFTPLMIMERIGLRGPRIGRFYRQLCAGDPVKALALLHAVRLKLLTGGALKRAADGQGPKLDVDGLLDLVRGRIASFGRHAPGN